MKKKKSRLAIGGKIVGGGETKPPQAEAEETNRLQDETELQPPPQQPKLPKRHRLAIGGQLF